MAHPIYRNKDGKRLPSVTTIIGKFKESGGLVHWAWDLGMQGLDYRKVRDEAADAGTLAHHLVELDIRGKREELALTIMMMEARKTHGDQFR